MRFMQMQEQGVQHGNAVLVLMDRNNFVTCADFSFAKYAKIEPAAAACQETLDHILAVKFQIQFEARKARLRDDHLRRADREAVSDTDSLFQQARRREVFAESPPWKIYFRQFLLPERIVFRRIGVHGLILPAMDGQIGLSVPVKIQFPHPNAFIDGRFEDARQDFMPILSDDARDSYL
jgi:hypothetical protein